MGGVCVVKLFNNFIFFVWKFIVVYCGNVGICVDNDNGFDNVDEFLFFVVVGD